MNSDPKTRLDTMREAVEAMAASWPSSDVVEQESPYIQRVVDGIGGLDLGEAPVAVVSTSALAFAIVDRQGALRKAEAGFTEMLSSDASAPSIIRLLRRAERGEPAVGLAEAASGAVVALCAASPEQASAWPLSEGLRSTLSKPGRHLVLMLFAPARASALALKAAAAFGLSELEARVATALLEAPTLEIAASRVGVGRETARDALSGAMRKMGVNRTPLLVRRLTDLICGATIDEDDNALEAALNLTTGEAKVARLSAEGATAANVALTLGLRPETVKSHLRSAFSKTGLSRAKDLGRLDIELHALQTVSRAQEILPRAEDGTGNLRIIVRPDGRRVAFIDYGPASGRLLFVCHALASGRTLQPTLAGPLREAGFRAVVPQRPGFGLTDPPARDYLAAVAEDMAAIMTVLKRDTADIFARDIATAGILAFAERFPERVGRVVLLNPEREVRAKGAQRYAIPSAARLLQRHPELTKTFFELLRRQTRTDRLAAMLVESFSAGAASDVVGLLDAERLGWMVRDIQAMVARTVDGMVRERLVYATGWRAPTRVGGQAWIIARCQELGLSEQEPWWDSLPNSRVEEIAVGGLLLSLTHPDAIVRMLTEGIG